MYVSVVDILYNAKISLETSSVRKVSNHPMNLKYALAILGVTSLKLHSNF